MSKLDQLVGWYELEPGKYALLTYAAVGDLQLVGLDDDVFSHHFLCVGESQFRWLRGQNQAESIVEFTDDTRGTRFSWVDESGNLHVAVKLTNSGYAVRELQYKNDDVALSGSLFLPRSSEPLAAVVMIHGSGTSHRDNLWYMSIMHSLALSNIAVLLPDKRGSGKSGGDWQTASFFDLANDVQPAFQALQSIEEIDAQRIGLWGLSQGGWIAPLAASVIPETAFVISISGAAVPPLQQLRHEELHRLMRAGLPRFLSQAILPIAVQFVRWRLPMWWQMNGNFDSIPYWKSLAVPALMVFGQDDVLVPVEASVKRLQEIERANARPGFTIQVYSGSGHGLNEPGTTRIRQDFLNLQSNWIHTKTARR